MHWMPEQQLPQAFVGIGNQQGLEDCNHKPTRNYKYEKNLRHNKDIDNNQKKGNTTTAATFPLRSIQTK